MLSGSQTSWSRRSRPAGERGPHSRRCCENTRTRSDWSRVVSLCEAHNAGSCRARRAAGQSNRRTRWRVSLGDAGECIEAERDETSGDLEVVLRRRAAGPTAVAVHGGRVWASLPSRATTEAAAPSATSIPARSSVESFKAGHGRCPTGLSHFLMQPGFARLVHGTTRRESAGRSSGARRAS